MQSQSEYQEILLPFIDTMRSGAKIKALAKEKGYTPKELSRLLGISRNAVCKWYNGINVPKVDNLVSMAYLFNVSMEELISVTYTTLRVEDE